MAALHIAVVRGEHNDRVVSQTELVQRAHDAPDIVVQLRHHRIVRPQIGAQIAPVFLVHRIVLARFRAGRAVRPRVRLYILAVRPPLNLNPLIQRFVLRVGLFRVVRI